MCRLQFLKLQVSCRDLRHVHIGVSFFSCVDVGLKDFMFDIRNLRSEQRDLQREREREKEREKKAAYLSRNFLDVRVLLYAHHIVVVDNPAHHTAGGFT